MQEIRLKNGLKVIYKHKPGNSVVVELMVKVGSNLESESERGISHFLEHILFEGTVSRPSNLALCNEIESIGGDFNAYTTTERTCYHIKVLKKHFLIAVEVLSDIMQNSLFKPEHIAKEKNIVLKEIDMVHDEPSYYQWILLQKNLFTNHPCKHPTYGDIKVIANLNQKKIRDYFSKYYLPGNMVLSIVGDVPDWKKEIEPKFNLPAGKKNKLKIFREPSKVITKVTREKKDIVNTYVVIGFKTIPRNNKDTYTLEVINGVLGRGQSGRMFTEIRSKRGLAYEVGTQNMGEVSFGFFAVHVTTDKKNVNLIRKLVLEEINKLKYLSEQDLKEAKDYIEGDYLLGLENSQKLADQILYWEHVKDANLMNNFIRNIKKVKIKTIRKVVDKYFKNHVMVVLEGK